MCVVSNIGDHYTDWLPKKYPSQPWERGIAIPDGATKAEVVILQAEVERLRKDIEQMKKELAAAKKQDEEDGNPDCEMEEKVEILKRIAKAVGVDLSEIWPDEEQTAK